ncbi:hypothetical protein HZH66_008835 [Vespula vulgaris]|uniref:Uncharacterized protein n=1 Tax=Vespula vulgaris TaxID=7454 RepID=A0A834N1J8_VESVU|nr:hypothetical protein HZH66_008835 [Vespula vulgaris]
MEVTWKERRRGYEGGGGDGGGGGGSGDGGAATGGIGIGERGKRRDIMENQGRSHGSDRMILRMALNFMVDRNLH